jgi:hypothetical protein
MLRVPSEEKERNKPSATLDTVFEGFRYIWREKMILGAISLDLFAVLLGGAVALLPVYAREILESGPWGLGILRSAPGVGAGVMAIAIAHHPLKKRAGATMLWCVAGFGLATGAVRPVAQLCAFARGSLGGRRDGHGERDRSRHADSGRYARRNARPGQRRGHDLHRRVERARPV